MRSRPRVTGLLLWALWGPAGCGDERGPVCEEGEPPRTILLLSLDTLRADRLGAYGYDVHPTTPALDAFAAENVLFERSVIQEPRTLTSHMSLLTGALPQHHRVGPRTPLGPDRNEEVVQVCIVAHHDDAANFAMLLCHMALVLMRGNSFRRGFGR